MNKKEKKAQAWTLDFIISIVIITLVIIVLVKYFFSNESIQQDLKELDNMYLTLRTLESSILSTGVPKNWTYYNYVLPGILTNNKLNKTKLENLKKINYSELKNVFGIPENYEFVIVFLDEKGKEIKINNVSLIGYNKSIDEKDIEKKVVIYRFITDGYKIIKLRFMLFKLK